MLISTVQGNPFYNYTMRTLIHNTFIVHIYIRIHFAPRGLMKLFLLAVQMMIHPVRVTPMNQMRVIVRVINHAPLHFYSFIVLLPLHYISCLFCLFAVHLELFTTSPLSFRVVIIVVNTVIIL